MFCQNCGYELADSANFCSKCGFKITANNLSLSSNSLSKDYDSEAMRIYLSNLLSLECMKKKLTRDWNKVNSKIKSRESKGYCERYLTREYRYSKVENNPNSNFVWFKFDGEKCYIAFHTSENGSLLWINERYDLTPSGTKEKLVWYTVEENFNYLNNKKNWLSRTTCPAKERSQVRDKFLECYALFKEKAPAGYVGFLEENKNLTRILNGVYDEFTKVNDLLEKAYNVNIIPKQFRNLQAIYFLYDFISTSNETLSTALLHCDLDVIKQKLDIIIEKQEEIIIGQAILAAQNKELINKHQQTLNRLSNIETSIDRSTQYAQIAANNAEACAWIGLANYIKN